MFDLFDNISEVENNKPEEGSVLEPEEVYEEEEVENSDNSVLDTPSVEEELFTQKEKTKYRVKADPKKKYDMVPKLTQQFRFCGNPFRIDCYKGCDFGCKYCFANASNLLGRKGWQTGDIARLERFMKRSLEKDEKGNYICDTNSLSMECVRHGVPMHCGGLSDPFQDREWELGITYRLLQLTKQYNYPVMFSTKGVIKDPKYWEVMDPDIHAFQLSLISLDDEFLRKYETNTPSAADRIAFARELHERGFWVSIRIQPCIDINKAIELVKEVSGFVNYITVEHLKIDVGNDMIKSLFQEQVDSGDYHRISTMLFEMDTEKKARDIERIKEISKCPIGCGDNDLHYLSDSDCCCGVDTIGPAFDNWIKYNLTYLAKHKGENTDDLWTPCQGCTECFFKGSFGSKIDFSDIKDLHFKDYVNEYCRRHPEFMRLKEQLVVGLFEAFEGVDKKG